jgi:hypothetical protein
MPLLGYGHLGPQGREVPSRVFFELSTWHLIHWLYQPRAIAQAQALWTNYAEPALHQRLMQVLHQRLGHHLAHDVEQAKILCSERSGDTVLDFFAGSGTTGQAVLELNAEDGGQRRFMCIDCALEKRFLMFDLHGISLQRTKHAKKMTRSKVGHQAHDLRALRTGTKG